MEGTALLAETDGELNKGDRDGVIQKVARYFLTPSELRRMALLIHQKEKESVMAYCIRLLLVCSLAEIEEKQLTDLIYDGLRKPIKVVIGSWMDLGQVELIKAAWEAERVVSGAGSSRKVISEALYSNQAGYNGSNHADMGHGACNEIGPGRGRDGRRRGVFSGGSLQAQIWAQLQERGTDMACLDGQPLETLRASLSDWMARTRTQSMLQPGVKAVETVGTVQKICWFVS
ncbi:uncharacterized protein [Lepidochelys kempii]|uniref:uncharacterized protein n=1 Tax=Lepidochelys kempii TaxID=8472 RepID=UPI003C6EFCE2